VGVDYYRRFADKNDLNTEISPRNGLLPDFSVVLDPKFAHTHKLNKKVRDFYEHTASYKLEVWSQWFTFISFFARILITSVSKRMNQLNIPLNPLETSRGMSSDIISLTDKTTGTVKFTCWLRKLVKSGRVVYAGFYTSCYIEKFNRNFVKVVFPLPKGNVTVILRVDVQPDGSVKLISAGKKIGDPGYYRVVQVSDEKIKARYIPIHESIHVYEDEEHILRTDHIFYFWRIKFLHLHYKILEIPKG
jgi:hypothetical protein